MTDFIEWLLDNFKDSNYYIGDLARTIIIDMKDNDTKFNTYQSLIDRLDITHSSHIYYDLAREAYDLYNENRDLVDVKYRYRY